MKNRHLVFVYGTLKRWHYNNIMLRSSIFVGEAVTCKPMYMYSYGVPIVTIPSDSESFVQVLPIVGEVYSVSKRILQQLDILEGHPDMYIRTLERVQMEDRNKKAYIYIRSDRSLGLLEEEMMYNEENLQEGIEIIDNKYKWVGLRVDWNEYN